MIPGQGKFREVFYSNYRIVDELRKMISIADTLKINGPGPGSDCIMYTKDGIKKIIEIRGTAQKSGRVDLTKSSTAGHGDDRKINWAGICDYVIIIDFWTLNVYMIKSNHANFDNKSNTTIKKNSGFKIGKLSLSNTIIALMESGKNIYKTGKNKGKCWFNTSDLFNYLQLTGLSVKG